MKKRKKITYILKVLPSLFGGNTFSINLFLFLGIVTFFVAGVDLSSELARDKQEINFVIDSLEDGCNIPQLSAKGLGDIDRPLVFEIQITDSFISSSLFDTSITDRGPPDLI
ncbi:MAG: hypothetical protein ABI543_03590 [Ignavibacteria bacterium]